MLMDKLLANENGLLQYIDPAVLSRFRGFGGLRLEDNVIVTEDGCENMTNCPRTVEDVEGVMNGPLPTRIGKRGPSIVKATVSKAEGKNPAPS